MMDRDLRAGSIVELTLQEEEAEEFDRMLVAGALIARRGNHYWIESGEEEPPQLRVPGAGGRALRDWRVTGERSSPARRTADSVAVPPRSFATLRARFARLRSLLAF